MEPTTADEKTNKNGIDQNDILETIPSKILPKQESGLDIEPKKKERKPYTKRDKTDVKTVGKYSPEDVANWSKIMEPILQGLNTGLGLFAKELEHTPNEIKMISELGGAVLAKHVNIDAIKYSEEIKLITYLIAIEGQKMYHFTKAKNEKEKAEKAKK